MKKNLFVSAVIVVMLISFVGMGAAAKPSKFPSKAITLICPFNPGGGADLTARAFAGTAPKYLGQSVIVMNKAGASGSVAHSAFKNEKPDGLSLIHISEPTRPY